MKKVSIIIPLYNREEFISDTLESVQINSHRDFELEVIVVDDGSSDQGPEIISKKYPWVTLIKQANSGAPTARNLGLNSANGEYILFLDSDDIITADFFIEKIRILDSNREIAAAYGPSEHFKIDEKGKQVILHRHSPYPIIEKPNYEQHLQNLLGGWYIFSHAILWRKSILLDQLKGYDKSLIINQDVDLLYRCLVAKKTIVGVNSPTALYRDHESNGRIGSIGNNRHKLLTILKLRKEFVTKLSEADLLTKTNKEVLGKFCFQYWVNYRKEVPDIAEMFYELSKELNPTHTLNGGLVLRLICKLVGARRTILLKSIISK